MARHPARGDDPGQLQQRHRDRGGGVGAPGRGQVRGGVQEGTRPRARPRHLVKRRIQVGGGVAGSSKVFLTLNTNFRMSTEFKKGYPHGPAELLNLDNETVWSGDFWNGVVISSDSDQEVGEDVRSRPMFGVTPVCPDSCCQSLQPSLSE